MPYDPAGLGADGEHPLVRRGVSWESAGRLAAQAALAERGGSAINGIPYGHGVSVTSPESNLMLARDPNDAVSALRRVFDLSGFLVRYTPTRRDPDHHTVQLPRPVTDSVAVAFNAVLSRVRRKP